MGSKTIGDASDKRRLHTVLMYAWDLGLLGKKWLLEDALRKHGMNPTSEELFTVWEYKRLASHDQIKVLEAMDSVASRLRDATAYVGVVGPEQGVVPEHPRNSDGLSLTELEFREARRLELPILMLSMKGGRLRGYTPSRKLSAFQRDIESSSRGRSNLLYREINREKDFESSAREAVAELRRLLDQPPKPSTKSSQTGQVPEILRPGSSADLRRLFDEQSTASTLSRPTRLTRPEMVPSAKWRPMLDQPSKASPTSAQKDRTQAPEGDVASAPAGKKQGSRSPRKSVGAARQPKYGRIFISYRREETEWPAGRLYDHLAKRFGRKQIFKDIDSIVPGDDFTQTIADAVGSCDVLLALIGNQWATMTDEHGNRRLDDPADFVRLEVEAALDRRIRIIPILVGAASMPRGEDLPKTLAPLSRRQALALSTGRFKDDVARLDPVIEQTLAEAAAARED